MDTWKHNINQLIHLLENLSVRDASYREIGHEEGFSLWVDLTLRASDQNQCIYFIGNGASASMASHFATDMAKTCKIQTNVFSDFSLLTALSNDICYEEVFAEPLRWRMTEGDMLVAISSSGNSTNIVRAVKEAKKLDGIVITISAMSEDNDIRKLGDLNFYVAAQTYGLAETAHAAILHHWVDLIEAMNHNRSNR